MVPPKRHARLFPSGETVCICWYRPWLRMPLPSDPAPELPVPGFGLPPMLGHRAAVLFPIVHLLLGRRELRKDRHRHEPLVERGLG